MGLGEVTSVHPAQGFYDLSLESNCNCDHPYWDDDWHSRDTTTTTTTTATAAGEVTSGLRRVPSLTAGGALMLMNVDGGIPLGVGLSGAGGGQSTHQH